MIKATLTYACFFLTTIMFAQVSEKEKQILLDFYSTTNGTQWVNTWDINEPVTSWHGLTIKNNSVTEIRLLFNNISGNIPASLGQLKNLEVLELSFNPITGNIPSELGNLNQLEIFAINGAALEGNIPTALGKLSNLKQLHLSSNKLSGEIPESLGNFQNIEVFNVFDNNLNGSLPTGLASCIHLKELMVAENNITNTGDISLVLLSNSGASLDLNDKSPQPEFNSSIIAVEKDDSKD